MEAQLDLLSSILNTLDINAESDQPLDTFDLAAIVNHLCTTLDLPQTLKTLRQLLIHCESTVLTLFFTNPQLTEHILKHLTNEQITFDSTKLFSEVFDESLHSSLITPEFIEKLVDSIGVSDSETCENIVKALILIARKNLNWILGAKNSRFFGEALIFRVNWAKGSEKKNLVLTINKVLKERPEFFYLNDLKVVADTLVNVLVDREEGILKESYEALNEMMKIEEFCRLGYRFGELAEVLQHSEDDLDICEMQCNILVKVELFAVVRGSEG